MEERGVEIDAVADIAQQVRDREAAGFVEQPARGEGARRVGELRLIAGQPAEAGLQRAQRHRRRRFCDLPFGPAEVAGFERGREPLVQPGGHAARRERADERVRELVREHAIELRRVLERAAHRHANHAVVRARGPGRRARDVAELLARVEHDRHRLAWDTRRRAAGRCASRRDRATSSASAASAASAGPSNDTVKCEPTACCIRSCSSSFAPPPVERRLRVASHLARLRSASRRCESRRRRSPSRCCICPSSARALRELRDRARARARTLPSRRASRRSSDAAMPAPRCRRAFFGSAASASRKASAAARARPAFSASHAPRSSSAVRGSICAARRRAATRQQQRQNCKCGEASCHRAVTIVPQECYSYAPKR